MTKLGGSSSLKIPAQASADFEDSDSSSSSSNEEEAQKIKAALCDESIFQTVTIDRRQHLSQDKSESEVKIRDKQQHTLKSNRTVDKNDDDHENVLQTTPGFRSYIARQLSSLLDGVVAESLKEHVWSDAPLDGDGSDSGIYLLSDSKIHICAEDKLKNLAEPMEEFPTKPKQRVYTMSSSSDSTDDERISACVFSVDDIAKENEVLSRLEQVKEAKDHLSVFVADGILAPSGTSLGTVKKKRKKKKKKKHIDKNPNIS